MQSHYWKYVLGERAAWIQHAGGRTHDAITAPVTSSCTFLTLAHSERRKVEDWQLSDLVACFYAFENSL